MRCCCCCCDASVDDDRVESEDEEGEDDEKDTDFLLRDREFADNDDLAGLFPTVKATEKDEDEEEEGLDRS